MRKTFKTLMLALPLAAASLLAQAADSPVGRWTTIDDETGKPKSVVQIEQAANGTLSGKVVEILQSNHGPNPTCNKCEGALKGKPIKGMTILWGLKPDGTAVWSGGSVLTRPKARPTSPRSPSPTAARSCRCAATSASKRWAVPRPGCVSNRESRIVKSGRPSGRLFVLAGPRSLRERRQ